MTRKRNGQFGKGTSGNPGGRPKGLDEFRDIARDYSVEAIEVLVKTMRGVKGSERLQAANILLDRAWGKPSPPKEAEEKRGFFQPVIVVRKDCGCECECETESKESANLT